MIVARTHDDSVAHTTHNDLHTSQCFIVDTTKYYTLPHTANYYELHTIIYYTLSCTTTTTHQCIPHIIIY